MRREHLVIFFLFRQILLRFDCIGVVIEFFSPAAERVILRADRAFSTTKFIDRCVPQAGNTFLIKKALNTQDRIFVVVAFQRQNILDAALWFQGFYDAENMVFARTHLNQALVFINFIVHQTGEHFTVQGH